MLHDGTPFLFHCTAGKDRTGFAAYLILKTLGVPDDCILHDYMQSNVYRSEENQVFSRQMPDLPGMEELLCVKEEYGIGPEEIAEIQHRYLY